MRLAARLIAGHARVPLSHLDTGRRAAGEEDRIDSAAAVLRASKLIVHTGRGVGIPAWHDTAPEPRALLVDDVDLATAGAGPPLLRSIADDGALVVAVMPRHLLVAGAEADSDLEPRWAREADLILEIRSLGIRGDRRAVHAGEAHLTALKHRRGPLFDLPLLNR